MDYEAFKTKLISFADPEYCDFAAGGTPTDYPFLGVRLPILRSLAKEIIRSGEAADFLTHAPGSFEEVTVQGIVIASLPYDEMKSRLPAYLPKIDNWGTCDTFANTVKSVKTHRDDFLDFFIDPVLDNSAPNTSTSPASQTATAPQASEFTVRLALVILLDHYVTEDYIHVVLDRIQKPKAREEYYIKMALAWALAECFIKFPDETYPILKAQTLPKWTHNKTISKICDSFRVDEDVKTHLKTLRQ